MNENEFLIIKTRRGGCWEDDEFVSFGWNKGIGKGYKKEEKK